MREWQKNILNFYNLIGINHQNSQNYVSNINQVEELKSIKISSKNNLFHERKN